MTDKPTMTRSIGRRLQTVADITEALKGLAEETHDKAMDVQTSVMDSVGQRLRAIADITEALKELAEKAHNEVMDLQTLERNWKSLAQIDLDFVQAFIVGVQPEVLADALTKVGEIRFQLIKQLISWADRQRDDDKK